MSVVVVGVNHRTAPLDLLERVSVAPAHLQKWLADVQSRDHVSESVILSTCNRTEIYVYAERFHGAFADVRDTMCQLAHVPPEDLADHLYVHYDEQAVSHLFEVTCGLDSAVLGENEIQGQVKSAWEHAQLESAVGTTLNALFRHALEVGKRARTETGISRNVTSVSRAAVAMAVQRLAGLDEARVMVAGAGDMGARIVSALAAAAPHELRVANRTWERAVELTERTAADPVRFADLPDQLATCDLLMTCTGADRFIIDRSQIAAVMARRPDLPLLIVDIAVPRDVDPDAAEVPGITLLDIDDVAAFVDAGVVERQQEVVAVQDIVRDEVARYLTHRTAREVAPLVAALRAQADRIRAAEIERFATRGDDLVAADLEAVDALVQRVVAKLFHEPTVRLKDASGSARGDRLAEAMRDLFDL